MVSLCLYTAPLFSFSFLSLASKSKSNNHHTWGGNNGRALVLVASSSLPLRFRAASGGGHRRAMALSSGSLAAAASAFALFERPAFAYTAEELAVALTKAQGIYIQIAGVLRAPFDVVRIFLSQFILLVEATLIAATPILENITSMALQAAIHLIKLIEKFLQTAGIDTRPISEALKTVALTMKEASKEILKALEPLVSSTLQWLVATDSISLFKTAGIVLLFYFLAPPIFSAIVSATKGYKGDLSALQALDMVMKKNYLLIDVRTEKEKSKSGIPSLPRSAASNLLFVPVEDLSHKFKGRMRDYRRAEAEVAAIKISYLKIITKASRIVILDRYGDLAKMVAQCLTRLGIRNTWVVLDGFDGGRGWVQSRLGSASYNTSIAEIFMPSRIITEGARRIFPSSKDIDITPQPSKLLPGGYNE